MAKTKGGERASAAVAVGPVVKDVLKLAYRARRPVLLEGPTGIGKSEIVGQTARDLGIGYVVLDLSLLEPPDLVGLPLIENGRTSYAAPAALPGDGAGFLMLEELNRAERYIQQPALQLLTARRLHQYELPPGWVPCAAINPEDDDYQVTPLDPALRSRFLNLHVRADRRVWLHWAEAAGVHPAVLALARRDERFLDGTPPRTWAYVSDLLKTLTAADRQQATVLRAALTGYLSPTWVELVLEALEQTDAVPGLDLAKLLAGYHRDPTLQKMVADWKAAGRTDLLDQMAYHILQVVDGPELNRTIGNKGFALAAFERLIADLPGDQRDALQRALGDNPAATALLNVKPTDLMRGYDGSPIRTQVAGWLNDPLKAHRVAIVVAALVRHLDTHPDLLGLRKDTGSLTGLGAFASQVGPKWAKPLEDVFERRNIQPTPPRKK